MGWPDDPGVVELPDGARLRGRALRRDAPPADWTLACTARPPDGADRWLRWRDFSLPADRADAQDAFAEAHRRALADEAVEVACSGGRGRTGTALACIAVLAGVPPEEAVAFVRAAYDARAVETPWQRGYVRRFTAAGPVRAR